VILATLCAMPAAAQERDTTDLEKLRQQVEAMSRELEELRLGSDVVVQADSSVYGFGPAASKVYKSGQGVSLGGYGEVLYENFAGTREDDEPSGATDRFDALRAILYAGYKFSDKLLFNSELEFEHGSTEDGGSVSIEFAYLDYRISPGLGVRAGLLLPPMGFINELHEPPTFLGARRPDTERFIIPSTWRENGIGVFGDVGAVSYRAYLVNGFDATGFSAEEGLREGRQSGPKRRRATSARSAGWTTRACSGSRWAPPPTWGTRGRARCSHRTRAGPYRPAPSSGTCTGSIGCAASTCGGCSRSPRSTRRRRSTSSTA
jgi:hypothetical protein